MDFTTSGIVASIRRLTATVNSRVVTDDEVIEYAQQALNDLYDQAVTDYEDYFRQTKSFALASSNSFDLHALLPAYQKLLGIDYLNGARTETVHRSGNFQLRNLRRGTRQYQVLGNSLEILADQFAGSYVLHYIPQCPILAEVSSVEIPSLPWTRVVTRTNGQDKVDSSSNWYFPGHTFTPADLDGTVVVANATQSSNNGSHFLTLFRNSHAVGLTSPFAAETFPNPMTATLTSRSVSPIQKTMSFAAEVFDESMVGSTITIVNSNNSNGTWTIKRVLNSRQVIVDDPNAAMTANEDFTVVVGATLTLANAVTEMPIELRPWREAVIVGGAIGVATKRNMTDLVATLTTRFSQLQARIMKGLANRDANEPQQAPIVGERFPESLRLSAVRDPDSVV